jgi:DNA-binding winged helix-turn-helix (wHTH) protein
MTNDALVYEFAGLRFSPFGSILENTASGKKIKLTQNHCHFLSALIVKSPEIAEYDELRRKIWVQYAEMTDSLKHLIQATKRDLVRVLRHEEFPCDFIEAAAGKGYQIKTPVKIVSENIISSKNIFSGQDSAFDSNGEVVAKAVELTDSSSEKWRFAAYRFVASIFYGTLFWLALLLEIAYQFDRYGADALWFGVPLIAGNGAVMFAALASAQAALIERSTYWIGATFLIVGAVLSCLAISLFLPFEPITAAGFQTQPAFAAFLKNVLIYFLPLGVFYIFTPFYLICRATRDKLQKILSNLFGLLFLTVIYSLFSTFYLLDNLLPSPFHGLFVTIVFLRFIVYFGLALACLLWAKSRVQ